MPNPLYCAWLGTLLAAAGLGVGMNQHAAGWVLIVMACILLLGLMEAIVLIILDKPRVNA